MNIKERIEHNIDSIEDDIDFNMLLFSEGKYEKEHLRTIIRNVGLKLDVTNGSQIPFEIESIYFGIFHNEKLTKLFSSHELNLQLPKILEVDETFTALFYGWNVKEKLEQFQGEKAMFIIFDCDRQKMVHSSKFDGDAIEKDITYLEDDEIANWGSEKYYAFDIDTKV